MPSFKKTKRMLFILLFIFLNHFTAEGQNFSVRINSAINFFTMEDLKEFQKSLNDDWLGTKTVESFPSYYSYQIQAAFPYTSDLSFGIFADYTSTGGRVDYEDYTGQIRSDQVVSRISIGALGEYTLFNLDELSFSLSFKSSYQISKLKLNSIFRIYNEILSESIAYNSDGFGIEPGINFGYTYSFFLLKLEASYQLGFSSIFDSGKDQPNNIIKGVRPEWDSFKLGLTFGINI